MSYIGRGLQSGAFRQLDSIESSFDGSTTGFTMQVNSTNVIMGDANQILLSLGGVIQKPGTDFTISSSTLTFTTAPATGTSFFAILIGSDNGGTVTPPDLSVTSGKLATTILTGATDIGANIADADLFLVDDGAGGTLRKTAASRLKTYIGSPGGATGLDVNDSVKIRLGTGNDTELYFDGSDSIIDHTPGTGGLYIRADATLLQTSESTPYTMLRYDAGGNVKIFTEASNLHSLDIENTHANPEGIEMKFSGAAPDNHTAVFFECADSSALRLDIKGDGDIQNHDNAYGQISDERIKQNITDASSQWDDIKALRVRNFERKDDVATYGAGKKIQIGLVAQECEAVSPGLISEGEPKSYDIKMSSEFGTLYEDGDTIPDGKEIGDVKEVKENVKGIKYSVLYMKAIKALQEAQTRIETLETKVAALEG